MKMPHKDAAIWALIVEWCPEVKAFLMAFTLAVLRIMYDNKESRWQRIILEALLCGALAVGLSSGLRFFHLDSSLAVFFGSVIGFFGVEFVRSRAQKYVDKGIDRQ